MRPRGWANQRAAARAPTAGQCGSRFSSRSFSASAGRLRRGPRRVQRSRSAQRTREVLPQQTRLRKRAAIPPPSPMPRKPLRRARVPKGIRMRRHPTNRLMTSRPTMSLLLMSRPTTNRLMSRPTMRQRSMSWRSMRQPTRNPQRRRPSRRSLRVRLRPWHRTASSSPSTAPLARRWAMSASRSTAPVHHPRPSTHCGSSPRLSS